MKSVTLLTFLVSEATATVLPTAMKFNQSPTGVQIEIHSFFIDRVFSGVNLKGWALINKKNLVPTMNGRWRYIPTITISAI